MLRLSPVIAQCSFHVSVPSFNTLLKSLDIGLKDSHNTNRKTIAHISKILMSKLDRKTTKQMTVIFKIGYTEMNVGVSSKLSQYTD